MSSFYGNMKNNSRASFIFDKIYPTRTAMEQALLEKDDRGRYVGDGIFINRYVLVNYHYTLADEILDTYDVDRYYTEVEKSLVTIQNFAMYYTKKKDNQNRSVYEHPKTFNSSDTFYEKKIFIDRFQWDAKTRETTDGNNTTVTIEEPTDTDILDVTGELKETDLYYSHRYTDWENYRATYDCTVWMKIYADGRERYIMVAELDAKAPIFEFIHDAPSCENGSGHFDVRASTDLNYIYFIPNNWNMVLNKYNPELADDYDTDGETNEYFYYQVNLPESELWFEDYIKTTDTQVQRGKNYFTITFEKVNDLEGHIGQSIKHLHYYNKDGNNYIPTVDMTIQEENVDNYYKITSIEQIEDIHTGDPIDSNSNYYEEVGFSKKTFNPNVEYPYFNAAGFDTKVSNHVDERGSGIRINKVKSKQKYPVHRFVHAGILTASTYLPNRYYTYSGPRKQKPANEPFDRDRAYYTAKTGGQLLALVMMDDGQYYPNPTASTYWYDDDLTDIHNFTKSTVYNPNVAYYELTSVTDDSGVRAVENKEDTYRVDVYLPELGNTVASIYDVIFGAPIVDPNRQEYNNLVGYCSVEQWKTYNCIGYCSENDLIAFQTANKLNPLSGMYGVSSSKRYDLEPEDLEGLANEPNNIPLDDPASTIQDEADRQNIPVYLMDGTGDYWAGNRIFNLSDEQFNALSPEIYPGIYDIPVYLREGSNVRPYNEERLTSTLAPPYDNLEGENVSVGWALTLLKRYLSELRYLSHGANGNGPAGSGIGLQSDWTLEDDEGFGYIYHKPILITNFTKTVDQQAVPNKIYYKEYVNNGEIDYEALSDHYNQVNGDWYSAHNFYYQNQVIKYTKITNSNATSAVQAYANNTNDSHYIIAKIEPRDTTNPDENINIFNYFNFFVDEDAEHPGDNYINATSYDVTKTYYLPKPLTGSDFSNYYYKLDTQSYVEITNSNKSKVPNNAIIYILDNGNYRQIQIKDFIQDPVKYYYKDSIDSPDRTPITASNLTALEQLVSTTNTYPDGLPENGVIGSYIDNEFTPVSVDDDFIGWYFQTINYESINDSNYIPITDPNYDNTKIIYKISDTVTSYLGVANNTVYYYTPIDDTDYNGFYYYNTISTYYAITGGVEGNYTIDKKKYKREGSSYREAIITDFKKQGSEEHGLFYTALNNQGLIDYYEITDDTDSTMSVPNVLYQFIEGVDSDQWPPVVYELPRSYTNNVEKNKTLYTRCTESSEYNENAEYYVEYDNGYAEAFYEELITSIYPTYLDNYNDAGVIYNGGFSIIRENTGTEQDPVYETTAHIYTGIHATVSDEPMALYCREDTVADSVQDFSIEITGIDPETNEIYEIHELLLEKLAEISPQRERITRYEVLDFLNNTLLSQSQDYGLTYIIDDNYTSWTPITVENDSQKFFYAYQQNRAIQHNLTREAFNANKTRYFIKTIAPVEQEDYEIHRIWNSVLQQVLVEP